MLNDQETSQPGSSTARNLLKPLASLKLTVGLFALCMGLVFFGTLAQLDNGIWKVVEDYFWSWFVKVRIDLLAKFGKVFFPAFFNSKTTYEGFFYFPAGKLIGLMLLINLLAAHLIRFKLSWNRSGILMIHGGMILMLVGEAITRTMQVEQRMSISEGQGTNFADDNRNYELAFVDVTHPNANTCTVVPFPLLKPGEVISHPDLPVNLSVVNSMVNARLDDVSKESPAIGNAGNALMVNAIPTSEVSGLDTESQPDMPAVYVKFINKKDGQPSGTYLFSLLITLLDRKEPIEIDGHKYEVSLRFKRLYKPYTVFLKEFRFDRFQGTSMARNFSSDVIVVDPERHAERAAHISMNDPLRYRGEAYYQAGYDQKTEKGTILQVVQNPGWLIPYISCIIVTLGMIVHFSNTLPKHAKKISIPWASDTKPSRIWNWAGWAVVIFVGIGAFAPFFSKPSTFDLTSAGRIPVLDRGRVKPLETLARVSLRMISGQETFTYVHADGSSERVSAVKWFFDVASQTKLNDDGIALKYAIFKVDNEQVQNELGLKNREGQRYSFQELAPKLGIITRRATEAGKKKETERDLTQQKFFVLAERLRAFMQIYDHSAALMIPPTAEGGEWESFENVVLENRDVALPAALKRIQLTPEEQQSFESISAERKDELKSIFIDEVQKASSTKYPAFTFWNEVFKAYHNNKSVEFNRLVTNYRDTELTTLSNGVKQKAVVETIFERIAPFFWCIILYIVAFVISMIGICGGPTSLQKTSYRILLAAFILHTAALVVRIILQGRPPVTNLYSSAIFIGWAAVGFGLFFEWYFRGGFANIVGSVLGGLTTIVAHGVLGTGSDTMEMLQAVLDTNFWLATHVICITLGYVATYFAGVLGLIYAIRRVAAGWGATNGWPAQERTLTTMTYIVLCIAMTLSFLGTVLGGIWADQSWGRFWGWDPKENGAVLIVIWNALILHARWGGMIKGRGIAVLAIIGAMVTTWSWFGTNQLGIGLHAYGFSTELAVGCAVSWVGLGIVALLGMMPKDFLPALNRTND